MALTSIPVEQRGSSSKLSVVPVVHFSLGAQFSLACLRCQAGAVWRRASRASSQVVQVVGPDVFMRQPSNQYWERYSSRNGSPC
jgi:hypothetical protein